MDVVYQTHPDIEIASNIFRNVQTILQYEDVPMLQVGKVVEAGFSVSFPVYDSSGVKVAVVKGARIFLTEEGKKAKLGTRHEANLTVFELEGKPIVELRRSGAAALKGQAELYAPQGVLLRANNSGIRSLVRDQSRTFEVGGFGIRNYVFDGHPIAITVTKNSISIGGGGAIYPIPGEEAIMGPVGSVQPESDGGLRDKH